MKLTVLGCYGPYPPAGGCCSGYLIREEGWNLLIDCGNGVLSRLQEQINYQDINAVILSHLHADHVSDIMIMRYGLEIAYNRGLRSEPLPLFAPAEPASEFDRLPYKNAYSVTPIGSDQELQIGPFTIQVRLGIHSVPSLALRVRSLLGTLVYSSDTEYYRGLEEFASGSDLFLCEANFQAADIQNNLPNHLSAAQAAEIAAAAKVDRLVLTHHHPERDLDVSLAEAKKYFPTTELAREGKTYSLVI